MVDKWENNWRSATCLLAGNLNGYCGMVSPVGCDAGWNVLITIIGAGLSLPRLSCRLPRLEPSAGRPAGRPARLAALGCIPRDSPRAVLLSALTGSR